MARILPDREIAPLIGKVIVRGSQECVRQNSYELRLGDRVKFDSTGEEIGLPEGCFLEIEPGDFVTIASYEKLDFRRETLASLCKKTNLMGLITPTTTMMREGFLFTTTKVDPGFLGTLNWGIRNSSTRAIRLKHRERLFKLTLYELAEDEVPDRLYGETEGDAYHGSEGITPSARMIPAVIPDTKIIRRTERKIDPNKQLLEAGYPFSHIGTELIDLHGKWEVVSKDVVLLKDEFAKMRTALQDKIEKETETLSNKLGDLSDSLSTKMKDFFADQIESFFGRKMLRVYGTIAAIASFGASAYSFVLRSTPAPYHAAIFLAIGVLAVLATLLLSRK
jgi:deoxycytidine triphosphate deaminase